MHRVSRDNPARIDGTHHGPTSCSQQLLRRSYLPMINTFTATQSVEEVRNSTPVTFGLGHVLLCSVSAAWAAMSLTLKGSDGSHAWLIDDPNTYAPHDLPAPHACCP
jgi:hypothetical protein